MSWGEAQRLTLILLKDTSSQVATEVRGWVHPITREDMMLREIFDLQHISKAKRKPAPYPRPWHPQPKKFGGMGVSADQFEAIKNASANN